MCLSPIKLSSSYLWKNSSYLERYNIDSPNIYVPNTALNPGITSVNRKDISFREPEGKTRQSGELYWHLILLSERKGPFAQT